MTLPASIYTQWYWKTDLHNLLHFLRLRADPHAQWEIRAYAEALGRVVADWVPLTWGAYRDYREGAVTLSAQGVACLRRMLAGEEVTEENSGMSKREWRGFRGGWGGMAFLDGHRSFTDRRLTAPSILFSFPFSQSCISYCPPINLVGR
jgi:thymidylate synthase (FAD)